MNCVYAANASPNIQGEEAYVAGASMHGMLQGWLPQACVQCEHVPVACGAQRRFPSQCGKLKMSTSFSLLHDIAGSHGLQISQFSYKVSGPGLVLSEIIAVSTHGLVQCHLLLRETVWPKMILTWMKCRWPMKDCA